MTKEELDKQFQNFLSEQSAKGIVGKFFDRFKNSGTLDDLLDLVSGTSSMNTFQRDPLANLVFNRFCKPARSLGQAKNYSKAFDTLNEGFKEIYLGIKEYQEEMPRNFDKTTMTADFRKRNKDSSWAPEKSLGDFVKGGVAGKVLNFRRVKYDRFPMIGEFKESVVLAASSILVTARQIIGEGLNAGNSGLLSKQEHITAVINGVTKILSSLQELSTVRFKGQTRGRRELYSSSYSRDFALNDISAIIDKENGGVTQDLVSIAKELSKQMNSTETRNENKNKMTKNKLGSLIAEKVLERLLEMSNGEGVRIILTEEELDEASVTGNIGGYTLPLGAGNDAKKEDTGLDRDWKDLEVSTENVGDNYKQSFKKGAEFYFGSKQS